jgi:hypothetical protein
MIESFGLPAEVLSLQLASGAIAPSAIAAAAM